MHHNFTIPTLLSRLLDKARAVAPITTTDDERFDALYEFAAEVRDWLDQQPAPERRRVLEILEQYRRTGDAPGMPAPQDAREQNASTNCWRSCGSRLRCSCNTCIFVQWSTSMHYLDISLYDYAQEPGDPSEINVGWLDGAHPYSQGTPPDGLLDRLWVFCRESVNVMRGFHKCELCEEPGFGLRLQRGDEELSFGSAEIRVFGPDGTTYAAPNLIYHYIADHGYLPPDEFIQAVMHGPLPDSPEYLERAKPFEWGRRAARERRFRDRA